MLTALTDNADKGTEGNSEDLKAVLLAPVSTRQVTDFPAILQLTYGPS